MDLAKPTTRERLHQLADASHAMVDKLRQRAMAPSTQKDLKFRTGVLEAAEILNCSPARIRAAEEDGRLPPPQTTETNRRAGYTVDELWNMRQVLGLMPSRPERSEAAIIAMQNFKGGVGKSTTTVHLSHYLALSGYRVLVVDCDSQATTTTMFGLDPHLSIEREETLYPFLSVDKEQDSLHYAIKPTAWPNIDIIPSAQTLYEVEYELALNDPETGSNLGTRIRELKAGLNEVSRNYDIVLLDPPPALGMISIAVMQAANALLVPLAATVPDFISTAHFNKMLAELADMLFESGIEVEYSFIKYLVSKFDINDASQSLMRDNVLAGGFIGELIDPAILQSAEISHAFVRWNSIYELDKPIGAARTHKRCRGNLDDVFGKVEAIIRSTWTVSAPTQTPDLAGAL